MEPTVWNGSSWSTRSTGDAGNGLWNAATGDADDVCANGVKQHSSWKPVLNLGLKKKAGARWTQFFELEMLFILIFRDPKSPCASPSPLRPSSSQPPSFLLPHPRPHRVPKVPSTQA